MFAHREAGLSQRLVAQQFGIHSSAVRRELRRNLGAKGSEPAQAKRYSDQRRRFAWKWTKRLPSLINVVVDGLREE